MTIGRDRFLPRLRCLALESLGAMFDRRRGLFHFRVRRTPGGLVPEGNSRRYTAITLIGLAGEGDASVREVLSGQDAATVYSRLVDDIADDANLGNAALALWAGAALGHRDAAKAAVRLRDLRPAETCQATVELSWTLVALCEVGSPRDAALREAVAKRLMASLSPESNMFPHRVGTSGRGIRWHVSCFADLVYPVHALSTYARKEENREALAVAERCAEHVCRLQGSAGQWWWHYHRSTGDVVEGYPVYAVHQDAMAPMALFALAEAGGRDHREWIERGLEWLRSSPELRGGTLVDNSSGIVWRKVAREEPGKISRYLQAAAAGVHPRLRVPGLNALFPPGRIDFEDRPYHIGWLLYAWPPDRVSAWQSGSPAS